MSIVGVKHLQSCFAPAFNFIKFYKTLENAENFSKINSKNYFLS